MVSPLPLDLAALPRAAAVGLQGEVGRAAQTGGESLPFFFVSAFALCTSLPPSPWFLSMCFFPPALSFLFRTEAGPDEYAGS